MAKAQASVEELVGMIERRELRLPEMQRRFVWRSTRVRDLLDSLYRGYPSGTILLWESDEEVPTHEFAVEQTEDPIHGVRLLLDGQQRLTSLSAVIRGRPVTVRNRKRPIEILFNLEHPDHLVGVTEVNEESDVDDELVVDVDEEANEDELQRRFDRMTFVLATNKLAARSTWVKVSEVFRTDEDAVFLKRAGVERIDDPRYSRYSSRLSRLRAIRAYEYRMDILERSLSYDEVTEIFVRVNSLGAKLRSSDLALAQITAKWPHSLAIFEGFQSECRNAGFDLDLSIHLKNLVAFATGQSRFLTVGGLSRERLEKAWKLSRDGMEFALNFLKTNLSLDSPTLLSSPFLLVTLAYWGHQHEYRLSPEDEASLRFWALVSNAKGHYSRGSSETILDQDLAVLRDGNGMGELIDRLRLQVGRLNVTPDDLEGRNARSALFKTMFLAFRSANAKDWFSNLTIALDHAGVTHRLQFHHIFPKAVLKAGYTSRDADDIANLAFIAGKTNRSIAAKPPKTYLPAVRTDQGDAPFATQCIPMDPELWEVAEYKRFISNRRILIADRLNEYLEHE